MRGGKEDAAREGRVEKLTREVMSVVVRQWTWYWHNFTRVVFIFIQIDIKIIHATRISIQWKAYKSQRRTLDFLAVVVVSFSLTHTRRVSIELETRDTTPKSSEVEGEMLCCSSLSTPRIAMIEEECRRQCWCSLFHSYCHSKSSLMRMRSLNMKLLPR